MKTNELAVHRRNVTRRRVLRAGGLVVGGLVFGLSTGAGGVAAQKPDFTPRIWGDGREWGTKVTGQIKRPNPRSLDRFFVITNPVTEDLPEGTLPVSEAAPGNPDYNGGRWWTHTVRWTESGIDAHGSPPPLLTRYGPDSDPESIQFHEALGHLEVTEGSPPDGPPDYFRCPMLPVNEK